MGSFFCFLWTRSEKRGFDERPIFIIDRFINITHTMSAEPDTHIAHTSEDGRPHRLRDHLEATAELAATFAAEFGCGEWGRLALKKLFIFKYYKKGGL